MIVDQNKFQKTIEYLSIIKCIKLTINSFKSNNRKKMMMQYWKLKVITHHMIKTKMIIIIFKI